MARPFVSCLAALAAIALSSPAGAAQRVVSHGIDVTNHRSSAVVMLAFGTDDDPHPPANVLRHPLQPGATVKVTVKAQQGSCSFTVVGRYEDGTDFSGAGLDLCTDHTLVLVD
jgi:hypothetical protein